MEEQKPEVALNEAQANLPATPPQTPLPISWTLKNPNALGNVQKARALHNMKHGMYSGVPIVCQGSKCPFYKTCWIPDNELEVGSRCPIEIGAILERFDKYEKEWNVTEDDTTDHGIIRDIIDVEILMLRADNALAISGDFIEDVIVGTDSNGKALVSPQLHKAFDAKSKLRMERLKLLEKMNATRKDKKLDNIINDPSTRAAALLDKVKRLQAEGKIIDVTPGTQVQEGSEEDGRKDDAVQGGDEAHLQPGASNQGE